MITLNLSGNALTDQECEETYQEIKRLVDRGESDQLSYDSENLLVRLRVAVAEGDLLPEDIKIYWNALTISIKPDGDLEFWPENMYVYYFNLVRRLLRAGVEVRKREREAQKNQ